MMAVMNPGTAIRSVCVYPLRIPMRRAFRHAAHERREADPVVVAVELADGTRGYGETLPRSYVTGETTEDVIEHLSTTFAGVILDFRPASFPDALERIDQLPHYDAKRRVITATRAALELALLDASTRHFCRSMAEVFGWLGLPGFGSVRQDHVRYSGVISGDDPGRLKSSIRKMRCYGLKDFKLKVGDEQEMPRIRAAVTALGSSLGHGTTLRLDANGGWTLARAVEVLREVTGYAPISAVEQPFPADRDDDLAALKQAVDVCIVHDESFLTLHDAQRLRHMGVADMFNIRISKNGGFLAAVRLAHEAAKHSIRYQLGCMVGETSILSAAGRHFLAHVPGVVFAEGCYGRFLIREDVTDKPLRFGYGGKVKPLSGPGWGIDVCTDRLEKLAEDRAVALQF